MGRVSGQPSRELLRVCAEVVLAPTESLDRNGSHDPTGRRTVRPLSVCSLRPRVCPFVCLSGRPSLDGPPVTSPSFRVVVLLFLPSTRGQKRKLTTNWNPFPSAPTAARTTTASHLLRASSSRTAESPCPRPCVPACPVSFSHLSPRLPCGFTRLRAPGKSCIQYVYSASGLSSISIFLFLVGGCFSVFRSVSRGCCEHWHANGLPAN